MKLRTIDRPTDHTDAVAKQYALEAERRAFTEELDLEVLGDDAAEGATERASKDRAKAEKAKKAAKVTAGDVKKIQKDTLDAWIGSLESEYLSHKGKLEVKTALKIEGKDEDGLSVEDHAAAISIIENAHSVATGRLDALDAPSE